ncbi:hypothetical protein AX15_004426 [Amanita polypyramis BW_CC]|nr:hypothetical protein AX15_004426 [Amanita polypyramis BW_CC]
MTSSSDSSSLSTRPTLPPLHTLNLPIPTVQTAPKSDDSYEFKPCRIPQNAWSHNRQLSASSSVTSRSPSPSMFDYFATRSSISPSPVSSPEPSYTADNGALKVRLVPCPFETADAYIYVPPTTASSPTIPAVFDNIQGQLHGSQPLLLVGPAAKQLRQPNQKIARGARVHPYRITPGAHRSTSRAPKKPQA